MSGFVGMLHQDRLDVKAQSRYRVGTESARDLDSRPTFISPSFSCQNLGVKR